MTISSCSRNFPCLSSSKFNPFLPKLNPFLKRSFSSSAYNNLEILSNLLATYEFSNKKRREFLSKSTVLENYVNLTSRQCDQVKLLQKHIWNNHQFILEGSDHLDPNKSTVLVFGPQFYNKEFTEPLRELLKKCKKMILADVDADTLAQIRKKLNNPKVVTRTIDLTSTLNDLMAFESGFTEDLSVPECIEKVNSLFKKIIKDTRNKPVPFGILEKGETADYVISSLVGSELARMICQNIAYIFSRRFENPPFEILVRPSSEKLLDALAMKHIKDLSAFVNPSGRVYFADKIITPDCKKSFNAFTNEMRKKDKIIFEVKEWPIAINSKINGNVKAILTK